MKQINKIAFILLVAIGTVACGNRKDKKFEKDLSDYSGIISAISSGAIRRADPIVVVFTKDIVEKELIGKTLEKNPFVFKPEIKGKCSWKSPNTLVFKPEKPLNWNTNYEASLNLEYLLKLPEKLEKKLNFSFFTAKKQLKLSYDELRLDEGGNYFLEVYINTSDRFDSHEIEQSLIVEYPHEQLSLKWEHNPETFSHTLSIRNIVREKENSELVLNIKPIDNSYKPSISQYSFTIPGTDVFMLSSVKVKESPDQVLEIVFSDLLNMQQDLRGLVSLDEQKSVKYTIDNNVLKIYPSNTLSGEFTLNISRSVENKQGKTLQKNYSQKINFGRIKPAIRLLGKGVIMPQSQGLILPFSAAGLKAVDLRVIQIFPNNIVAFFQDNDIDETYKWGLNRVGRTIVTKKISLEDKGAEDLTNWNAFSLDLASFIDLEPGSIYNVELGFRKAYSLYEEQASEETDHYLPIDEEMLFPGQSYENTYYNYYYDWRNYENPASQAYFSPNRFVNRNVFCSDLALIAKMDAKGQMSIYVSNLMTTASEAGVQLSVYDYQNQLLTRAQTDGQGYFRFTPERAPFVLFAQKGNQYAYLKLDNSSAIPVANFDTDGIKAEKGIKAFFYAERDVWRPGDSIYLHLILEDREQQLPEGHPINMEIYNPRGQFVKKILTLRDERCIYPFYFATSKDDPTGNWKVVVKAGTHIFQRGIQVESIKPNRLKIELEIREDVLSKSETSWAKLKASWLHGTPAANMKAQVSAVLHPYTPTFEKYKDFDFSTPYPRQSSKEFTLFDGQLDYKGEASVTMSFGPGRDFEGYMQARISTKVYEGGGFSINQRSIPFIASEHFVGLKMNYSYPSWKKLDNDKNHRVEVVSVDEKGNPADLSNIEVKLYDLDYHWWYQSNSNLLASYAGQTYHNPVYSTKISTNKGKGSFELSNNSQRYGCYLLLVTAPDGHTCGQQIYFGLPWGSGIQKGDAQVLALVTERDQYKTGETASLSFPAGKDARALVTLENGKGILHQEWLDNLEAMNEYRFVTTPDMAPNVYVNIMLIQAYAQTANDLPIRLFGLTSFRVEDEQTRLHPVLDIPDELRPEKEYTIRVSESNKQAMDYTIALVDEGLLDLTNFSTPDPWAHFYAKEALGTKTYDMYNEVLGSFGSRLESMYAIGGSDQEIDYSKKKADRFVPIVEVLGPFRLQAGKKAEHKIQLKPYAGSVRAMLIAAGRGRYGSMEKSIRVSEPLMLYASLPRTLALGEKADLPLTVFAMDESIKTVRIRFETEGRLQGSADTLILFDTPGQQDVFFDLKAAGEAGLGIIKLSAVSGREKTQHSIELDVMHNNPPSTEQVFKMLPSGESWQANLSALGVPGTNKARLEISSVLPLNLEYQLSFLNQYPHQCAEQVVSAVFPLIYVLKLLDLSAEKRKEYEQNIKDCIDRLPRYQSMDRGFAFWPGRSVGELWLTSYLTYFMLEAEKAAYLIPSNLKRAGLDYLANGVRRYREYLPDYKAQIQAYALFVLARAGEPEVAAMNRLMKADCLNNQGKWLLASAYAASGMKEAAYKLIDLRDTEPGTVSAYTYGSVLRDRCYLLQSLMLLGEWEQAAPLALKIATDFSRAGRHSTQTTGFVLSVLSEFCLLTSATSEAETELYVNGKPQQTRPSGAFTLVDLSYGRDLELDLRLVNKGKGTVFASLFNQGVKAGMDASEQEKGLALEISYMDQEGKKLNVSKLKQGTNFIVQLRISNKTAFAVDNLALTQMIPAGWEIINERLFGTGSASEDQNNYDYRDIRDDRVNTYFSLGAGKTKVFTLELNASYCGDFILAPVLCEAMYDQTYYARKGGGKVKVER